MKKGFEQKLIGLSKKHTLTEVAFLMWKGRLPEKKELKLVEMMFVIAVDHGPNPPSTVAAVKKMQESNNLSEAVAEGVRQINEGHGGAIAPLISLLKDKRPVKDLVKEYLAKGLRLPGFGHRIYKNVDPRTKYLFNTAKRLGFYGKYVKRALEIEKILEKEKGIKLPLNIDGALAALICELKIDAELANGFFIFPRVAGLIARVTNKIS